MAAHVLEREPATAAEDEHQAFTRAEALLENDKVRTVKLVGPNEEIELPETAFRALRQIVSHLAQDRAVSIVPVHKELTTQQAANFLGMSRPYLIKLLDHGDIPYTKTGSHRRIKFDDLLVYKRQRQEHRHHGVARLTQLSEELGLYD